MKILILKPSSLGDVVQALPVLRLLKRHLPQSEIYWWIQSNLAPLLQGDPDLTGVLVFERQKWAHPTYWPELWRTIRKLRAHKFDYVLDLQSLARSGAFAWLANGGLTLGLDEPREGARGFYDIIISRPSYYTHAVDWYLRTLPALGVPVHNGFDWLPARPAVAEALRQKFPLADYRWLVLQPGARWSNKRWPVENYSKLIELLAARDSTIHFAILGGAEDAELGKTLANAHPARTLDLTGKLSLLEMVEMIRLSDAMVTNDTGPMHVAAALGKKLVAPFGPTEPRRTGPYRQLENALQISLPCIPCMKSYCAWPKPLECLTTITPESVVAKLSSSPGFREQHTGHV